MAKASPPLQISDDDYKRFLSIIRVFKPERMAYLVITITSFLALLVCVIFLFLQGSYGLALGAFGSSGVIGYTAGRVLKVYEDTVILLLTGNRPRPENGGGNAPQ